MVIWSQEIWTLLENWLIHSAHWNNIIYFQHNSGASQSQPIDPGVLTKAHYCAVGQGKKSLTEMILFHLMVSFMAAPHSVAWGICWTLKRHICSFTLASVKVGRHMFSLFSPPVGSLKSVDCQTPLWFPKLCASEKSLPEFPVLIDLPGNNSEVWLESQWIGSLPVTLHCPALGYCIRSKIVFLAHLS